LNPTPSPWQSLLKPYRRGDWHDCIDLLRLRIDEHPDDLASRLLLASLYIKVGNPGLAQLQVERVLPLAVGQRDLYSALGAQKRLDQLRTAENPHRQRYVAMHQWFGALAAGRGRGRGRSKRSRGPADEGVAPPSVLSAGVLLELAPEDFHRVVEDCVIEELDLEPDEIPCDPDEGRVMLYGRVRWALLRGDDDSPPEREAGPGDEIAFTGESGERARLMLTPVLPSACLRFRLEILREFAARTPPPASPHDRAATVAAAPPAPARFERPVPDPIAEPLVASGAPTERRRSNRVSVAFDTRIAMLGIAGTRVAPFAGRLFDLSPAGMGVGFPRGDLRQVRGHLEGALLTVELQLPGDPEPLPLTARVRWVSIEPGGDADSDARIGLEFVLVRARDRARIQELLIRAARAGQALGAGMPEGAAPAQGAGPTAGPAAPDPPPTNPLDGEERAA
jgi:hypothetical protein